MRLVFLLALLMLNVSFAFAKDIYGPEHKGMNRALWSADGEQFVTWGWSPYVYVWRDSDGLLLLELDHRPIMTWAPDQYFVAPNAYISDVHWSEDGELILTRAYPQRRDKYVHQQAWSAETGELLYSYVIKAFHPHGLNRNLHKVITAEALVFTWAEERLALVDINPESETVGEALTEVDFGGKTIVDFLWSDDAATALLKLRDDGKRYCDTCKTWFKLVDTDLSSDSFGATLWQTMTAVEGQAYIWPKDTTLLAIHSADKIELWDLDLSSTDFGASLLRIKLERKWFHSLLLDTDARHLIVVEQNNMDYIEGAHPDANPQCHDENCEYHIGIWDVDPMSPGFGQRALYFAHHFPDNNSRNRVQFNSTGKQLHIKTFALISRKPSWEWEEELTAYDLLSGDRVEAQDTLPEPETTPEIGREFPDVDRSNIPEDFYPIAVNPAGTKVMTMNCEVFPCLYFIFDLGTGEWLLPRLLG